MQAHNFVSDEILRMDPEEGIDMINCALKICRLYRDNFFTKKAGLAAYFRDKPVVPWDFKSSLVFSRVDRFISQLQMIAV